MKRPVPVLLSQIFSWAAVILSVGVGLEILVRFQKVLLLALVIFVVGALFAVNLANVHKGRHWSFAYNQVLFGVSAAGYLFEGLVDSNLTMGIALLLLGLALTALFIILLVSKPSKQYWTSAKVSPTEVKP
jgi:hypothetical protein